MEYLIKQVRVRHSGIRDTEVPGSNKGRRIPSQKSTSFKEEKKRPNWFQRQFSLQMNQDNDPNEMEKATAVAAVAYAITSLEVSSFPEQKKISEGLETTLTQSSSKKKDKNISISEPGEVAKQFPGEGSMTSSGSLDSKVPETAITGAAPPIKRTATFTDKPTPSMKKTPTFADKSFNDTNDIKPHSVEPKTDLPAIEPEIRTPNPDFPTTSKPATQQTQTERQISKRPAIGGTKADAWERDEFSKIQKRYEELNKRILLWENKKKAKAKKRLDKKESELAQIRIKASKQFHDEMDDIDQIAAGAKAKAAERQRKEEFKAKEKANTIRQTGKVPRTCFCF